MLFEDKNHKLYTEEEVDMMFAWQTEKYDLHVYESAWIKLIDENGKISKINPKQDGNYHM